MTPEAKTQNMNSIQPQLFDRKQLAKFLSLSPAKISRMWRYGLMPEGFLIGGKSRRWNRDEITAWIDSECPDRETWDKTKSMTTH